MLGLEDPRLPALTDTQVDDLFSASAVGRHGQWDPGEEDWDSEVGVINSPQKASVVKSWDRMRRRRVREVSDGREARSYLTCGLAR
jgi:hypothetical protein